MLSPLGWKHARAPVPLLVQNVPARRGPLGLAVAPKAGCATSRSGAAAALDGSIFKRNKKVRFRADLTPCRASEPTVRRHKEINADTARSICDQLEGVAS
jgi:hypothetical protein